MALEKGHVEALSSFSVVKCAKVLKNQDSLEK